MRSTKGFFEKHSATFKEDIRVLAKTTSKDIEDFQHNIQQAVLQNTSLTSLIGNAKSRGATNVQKTLQHLLMHTANAPFTEGYKMGFRHLGHAMNHRFGAFSSFFTSNFADTYHVMTKVLEQGAGEPLGWRPLNLLQDSPPMPTSKDMHKIVATRPMIQANLFLLLDALTHKHMLCCSRAFIGQRLFDPNYRGREPRTVEDYSFESSTPPSMNSLFKISLTYYMALLLFRFSLLPFLDVSHSNPPNTIPRNVVSF